MFGVDRSRYFGNSEVADVGVSQKLFRRCFPIYVLVLWESVGQSWDSMTCVRVENDRVKEIKGSIKRFHEEPKRSR
jgi:hypothetical protein